MRSAERVGQLWRTLTEPAASIQQPELRRRSRLLASLLLILIPYGLLTATAQRLIDPAHYLFFDPDFNVALIAITMSAALYGLNRSGHYTSAALLAVALTSIAIFVAAFPDSSPDDVQMLAYLTLGVLLCSMLFSWRATLILLGFNVVGSIAATALFPVASPALLGNAILFVIAASGIIIIGTRYRDLLEIDRRAELTASEERYRSLFENMLTGFAYCKMLFEHDRPQDFIYLAVNRVFDELTGLKDVVGKKVTEVIPGIRESNPELFEIYGRVSVTGRSERFETYLEPLGIWFSVSVYSTERAYFVAVFDNITERKRIEEALAQRVRVMTALDETSLEIHSQHDLSSLLNAIVRRAASLIGAPMGGVYLVRPEDQTLEFVVSYNMPRDYTGARLRLGEGLSGRVAQTGAPMMIADYDHWEGRSPVFADTSVQRVLGAPLKIKGSVIGVINVADDRPTGSFSEDDVRLMTLFADQAAIAITNARLLESEQRRAEQLVTISRVAQAVSASLDAQAVYQAVYRHVSTLISCDSFILSLFDEEAQTIRAVFSIQDDRIEDVSQFPALPLRPPGEGTQSEVIRTGRGLIVSDLAERLKGQPVYHIGSEGPYTQAAIYAPLKAGGRTIGVMQAQSYRLDAYRPEDLTLLEAIGGHAAAALVNARLYEETRAYAEQFALLYDAGLALNRVLDPRAQLETLLEITMKALHAERAEFFRYDPEPGEMQFELGVGYASSALDQLRPLRFRVTEKRGIVGQVGRDRVPLYMPDVSPEPDWITIDPEIRSGLWVPIEHEVQLRGVLGVLSTRPHAFTAQDQQLLMLFATQAGTALQNAQLFQAERTGRHWLQTLYRVGQTINSTLDTHAILDQLIHEAMLVTHATHGSALVANTDLGCFERRALRGYSPEQVERERSNPLSLDRGANGRVYRTGQVVYLSDAPSDPGYFPLIPETRSELVVPIMRSGHVLGNLDLQSPERDAFGDVDIQFLKALTDQVAIALENARLFEETRRRLDEMAAMSSIALIGAAGRPFDETMARATDALSRLWPQASMLGFMLVDEAGQVLRVHPSYQGLSPERMGVTVPLDRSISGWVVRERQPIRVGDVLSDPRYFGRGSGVRSEMVAPLVVGERVIGVVNVEHPLPDAFSGDDLRVLTTLAGQFATILERARLDAELETERASLAWRVAERTAELSVANAELGKVARAKDEFLASMSHELRTPLNAILGLSEALQEQTYGPLTERQLKSLRTIEESGRHLLALINDILDLSKIEAGKVELQIDSVSVESVCRVGLQFVKQTAVKKQIKVSSNLDPRAKVILADERRLKQILVNLLSNAVKFTPEGGSVGLETQADAENGVLRFTVWDTGIGIAHQDMGRLFKPFVQLDGGLSRQYAGSGLGLSLVQRMVEMHGGSVSVESDGVPGHGSRFSVSLPWTDSDARVPGAEKVAIEPPVRAGATLPARPITVLLVDDNEASLDMMSEYLQDKGYRVIPARNGREAVQRAREDRPDLILMDVQMPGMDGLEAIRHIRSDSGPGEAGVPIIALTALAMPGDRERCIEAGANGYLSKPVSPKGLIDVIQMQLAGRGSGN